MSQLTRRGLLLGVAGACLMARPSIAAARRHRIDIRAMRFGPMPQGIKAGDTIVWTNLDVVPHTATARDGSFDVELPARASAAMPVRRPGAFAVYCRYHPTMTARLSVAR
jgi:plastocyanin